LTDIADRTDPTADNPGGADLAPAPKRRKRAVTPRNAASLIVWRAGAAAGDAPEVLMGYRHAKHRFMPDVLVFPGGRVDRADHRARAATELAEEARRMLEHRAPPSLTRALAVAAARELEEETGLTLGGKQPDLGCLSYLCRAVTPPTRSIRFNARFLIAPAEALRGEIAGSGELEKLGWYGVDQAQELHLADITRRILQEFSAWLTMDPAARATRTLIVFRGNDNRMEDS
jgi:8-oxo-dGTP pyrophosphatase MutT (NUDIX family)